ncbi:hypothetical protein H4J51_00520 [Colwellia sp. MB02u-18]|uniref:hypothetical protein n=1 Tax=unclassified Colwellia TaxID=196834 RepID=UPI0015F465BC|nr:MULTISPECIES: hypothetical protein [unclassified Colwellia]MBA6223148.1 hypothetical protein [Colwellia sp. MB3u-45]MBA6267572.1 hypothetical protein [Colwellia sp. MB3u-43]MBA6320301.1 hypothetical protein [Colwellia sp. MB02u-19]MBA6323060.1 hypothetical protein [Colwellia sp. MB02u-18]MBA6330393.1 hypothetical protein [Colwellia sp. MB02u-12]
MQSLFYSLLSGMTSCITNDITTGMVTCITTGIDSELQSATLTSIGFILLSCLWALKPVCLQNEKAKECILWLF